MKQNVALVLSSGGSRGLAHIGVISELEKHGFTITSVSGSSIGAVMGGLYAMGKIQEYTKWVSSFNKRDIWGFMDFTIASNGLLKGERVFDKMKTFIPDMNIEDMPIPFAAVATDILHEKEVVFTKGSFYEAARASVAIPAVFTPVKYTDTILVDGGVLNPIPVEYVSRKNGDLLIVVNLYGDKKTDIPKESNNNNGFLNRLMNTISTLIITGDKHSAGYYSLLSGTTSAMIHRIAKMSIEKHKPDMIINIPYDSANTFDFYRTKELIELGKNAAKEAINYYYKNL
ncbi:MAG: patatin-like phospholipase family protein [Paludibacter sp.]|jgi:NTE family protein|uniref:NTE family protein n=1 Tax=Marinilabilia salmonicolor TaxID=989 RepID=A0A368UIW7_9BACT|nr:patatin-like phospholipase family protein [Marinilabilia salmonicolor]MBS4057509.1 patatin-like phospholipase family protein [Bacteroidales bacterium]MBU2556311.1 patatin-like phospholipase family protein [Bacteroidota bacterium]MEA4981513.1 patatin-like phospholipase family protein [Paludibacter sp.]RCW22721.1 NTE family protein [Marinilabilia salmonicolor]